MSEEPRYDVNLDSPQGSVIGDRPQVTQYFGGRGAVPPAPAYWLGRPDSLGDSFVGRADDLKTVNSGFSDKRACVVCGIPACGKSRLGAEFAHQWNGDGFWSAAGSTPTLTLAALAPALGLDIASRTDEDIAAEVATHLASLPSTVLWVIDNLPDLDFMNELLPLTGNIRILGTTRDNRSNLLPPNIGFVGIDILSPEASIQLLCSRSETDPKDPDVREIAEEVGWLPLALEALAARLAQPRQTPQKVLAELSRAPNPIKLQAFEDAAGASIPRADGVFNTFTGTLAALPNKTRRALNSLGYVADAPIPEALVMALTDLDDDGLSRLLVACGQQSILSDAGGQVVIHSLMTAAITATNPRNALAKTVPRFVARLIAINTDDPIALRAEIVHHERCLFQARDVLGPDNESVLDAATNVAIGYVTTGRPIAAIPIFEKTLKAMERALGPEHPATLMNRNNLANAYGDVGRLNEAIPILEESLLIMERVLGPEDSGTLTNRHNLAAAYLEDGRPEEAIPIFEETIKLRERVVGPEHRHTLSSRNNLAIAYQDAGKRDEAILLQEETLNIKKRVSGLNHPSTLSSRHNLGTAYLEAGRPKEAILILKENLEAVVRVLGPKHPRTHPCRINLAAAYRKAGRTKDADRLMGETGG